MPWGAAIAAGAGLAGSYMSGQAQAGAAGDAADAQQAASAAAIAEQKRQFNAIQKLLKPYVQGGNTALTAQLNLIGLGGETLQERAINQLAEGPQMDALVQQGENAIRQNASATGGLRGGNTQAALAQFRPQMLSQLIDSQYAKYAGLSNMGQNSAAMTGQAGMETGNQISQLLQQQGAAQAGALLAGGKAQANNWAAAGEAIGTLAGS
jgi:hypothetical protein